MEILLACTILLMGKEKNIKEKITYQICVGVHRKKKRKWAKKCSIKRN